MIETPAGLVKPEVRLVGEDGNAFAVIGRVRAALREAGNGPEIVKAFTEEATSDDYDHLLATAAAYAEVC